MIRSEQFSPPPFDRGEIRRYAACGTENDAVTALCEECICEAEPLLDYRVCSLILPIERQSESLRFGSITTSSTTLRKALTDCEEVVLFAATVGVGIDRLIARYGQISPSRALWFQAIGAERIESLCNAFVARREGELCRNGMCLKTRVSPGYGDIPLALQRDIFALLDCPRKIGLTLSESLLMSPTKSVTAFAGITPGTKKANKTTCEQCQKADCLYRKGTQ